MAQRPNGVSNVEIWAVSGSSNCFSKNRCFLWYLKKKKRKRE